jgi:hypothetical protein
LAHHSDQRWNVVEWERLGRLRTGVKDRVNDIVVALGLFIETCFGPGCSGREQHAARMKERHISHFLKED